MKALNVSHTNRKEYVRMRERREKREKGKIEEERLL